MNYVNIECNEYGDVIVVGVLMEGKGIESANASKCMRRYKVQNDVDNTIRIQLQLIILCSIESSLASLAIIFENLQLAY